MKKRQPVFYDLNDQQRKWLKTKCCPICGLPKSKWKRRTDWRCCSVECTNKFSKLVYVWQEFRKRALKRDNYSCVKCGDKREHLFVNGYEVPENPTWQQKILGLQSPDKNINNLIVDHIKPIAIGGKEYDLDNLQTLCIKCNKIKTAQDMKEIAKARRIEKKLINQTQLNTNI